MTCPSCNEEYWVETCYCPHCGFMIKRPLRTSGQWIAIFLSVIVATPLAILGGCTLVFGPSGFDPATRGLYVFVGAIALLVAGLIFLITVQVNLR